MGSVTLGEGWAGRRRIRGEGPWPVQAIRHSAALNMRSAHKACDHEVVKQWLPVTQPHASRRGIAAGGAGEGHDGKYRIDPADHAAGQNGIAAQIVRSLVAIFESREYLVLDTAGDAAPDQVRLRD